MPRAARRATSRKATRASIPLRSFSFSATRKRRWMKRTITSSTRQRLLPERNAAASRSDRANHEVAVAMDGVPRIARRTRLLRPLQGTRPQRRALEPAAGHRPTQEQRRGDAGPGELGNVITRTRTREPEPENRERRTENPEPRTTRARGHLCFSAITGSILVARQAGTKAAASATANSSADAPASVSGSSGDSPYSCVST
jgi:hypothetical protein